MSVAHLLVDVGNTQSKWWLEERGAVVRRGRCASDPTALKDDLATHAIAADYAALASVAAVDSDADFTAAIATVTGAQVLICRAVASYLGLVTSYAKPATMGVDRWLAMLAAWTVESGPVCVVDVGTAVTIDLVAANGQHEGGYILPGPLLMQEALVGRTQRIAVAADHRASLRAGRSTEACVASGAWLATAGALREVTARYPDHRIVACGGDAEGLLSLGFNAEWRPELVREGLSRWLSSRLAA